MGKPLILVTNDDGITAPGLRSLIHIMNEIGDVVVVAPDSPQSGMGHAITISDTLYCKKEKIDDGPQKEYSISGTPADCVKFAVKEILQKKPDLCVSGINHGSNSSINVLAADIFFKPSNTFMNPTIPRIFLFSNDRTVSKISPASS